MALVRCPECGKEGVSDSAEMCPECGYNIREHYQKIEEEEILKRIEERRLEKEKSELDQIKIPDPPGMIDFLAIPIGLLPFALLCLIIPQPLNIIGFLFFLILGLYMGWEQYNDAKKKYHLALTDFKKYQQVVLQEQKARKVQREREALEKQMSKTTYTPNCPICGSANVQKISVGTRAVKTAVFGTIGALDDAGKTYICGNCSCKF